MYKTNRIVNVYKLKYDCKFSDTLKPSYVYVILTR